MLTVSVVIPTLNEASVLPATLRRVAAQPGPKEVVVVDGQSTDGTQEVAQRMGATVLQTPPGRAVQMNRGAAHSDGDALLFLHADTLLPADGLSAIRRALADPDVDAGTFRLQFARETPLLRLYAWATRLPWIRIAFGDRGLFVRRAAFEAAGGYPEWPIFEDLELAHRLDQRGGFRFLNDAVRTSPRRFEANGTVRQQLRNTSLWLHYCLGTDPDRVAHRYPYR